MVDAFENEGGSIYMSKLTLADLRVAWPEPLVAQRLATFADLVEVIKSEGGERRFKPDGTEIIVLKLADPSPTVPWVEQAIPEEDE